MAKFCTECGKEIAAGVAFCTECGTKAPADSAPKVPGPENGVRTEPGSEAKLETPVYTPPARTYHAQQNYAQPQTSNVSTAPDPANKVVGTGTYFGLMLLFALPVIGFIACVIMAFAPKNKNLKHYARAMLIWTVIALVIGGLLFALISMLMGPLVAYINQIIDDLGNSFGQLGEIGDAFNEFGNIAGQFGNGELSGLPLE